MTDNTKKTAGMAVTSQRAAFMLDDRSIATRLDAFRQYCQRLPYEYEGPAPSTDWPGSLNWAQVLLGFEAGGQAPDGQSAEAETEKASLAGRVAWGFERKRLTLLYDAPERADGQLPPERAFLLAMLGMLETPRALFNAFPRQHRALYYQQMLGLVPRSAQADRVTVRFALNDGVSEQVLPDGLLLDAGQDSAGNALRYALTQPLTVNRGRLTDFRWVVSDPYVPGGRRARIILDETAGQPWPAEGVRLFGSSPAKAGSPPLPDTDRHVESGRIVESSVLAVAGGERIWTVTLSSELPGKGTLCAAVSIGDAWVSLPCQATKRDSWTVTLSATGGVPDAVNTLDGLVSAAPLLKLTSSTGAIVPTVKTLEVVVKDALGVLCARDDGTMLSGGGLPFGESAQPGSGIALMSPEWGRLGTKLTTVTVTPRWSGLPTVPFPAWYGADETQNHADWLLLDQHLHVTSDKQKGRSPTQLSELSAATLAGRVINGDEISSQISVDSGYPSVADKKLKANGDFTLAASLIRQGQAPVVLDGSLVLFDGDVAPEGKPLGINLRELPPAVQMEDDEAPERWPWCVRLQLTTSFLHDEFTAHERAAPQTLSFLTEQKTVHMVPEMVPAPKDSQDTVYKMVETDHVGADGKKILMPAMKQETLSIITPVTVTLPKAQWNHPYTPRWSSIQIDYQASDTEVQQRIILPFGYAANEAAAQPLAERAADVYLGLEGIEAGQQLTLHWQVQSPAKLPLEWQYLAHGERWVPHGERWVPLALHDGTEGWQNSGSWVIDWPDDMNRVSTSLPAGRMWLRGRVRQLPAIEWQQLALPTTPWLIGGVTNAVDAELVSPEQVPDTHFVTGLPAGSITQALGAPDTLQLVEQPWRSAGGQAAETREAFDTRVARRLRHRERGLNNIDLMMLLQERYAGIREMTVLPSSKEKNGALRQTIVVMPDSAFSDSDDAHRPGVSPDHLEAMAQGLQSHTSPWLRLECVNPRYISVSVSWHITYVAGLSRSVGDARVTAALKAAFMPWLQPQDDVGANVIGRGVTQGAVRDVLRQLPDVGSVHDVYLNGNNQQSPEIAAGQVAVLTCTPLEYAGMTLSCLRESKDPFGDEKNCFVPGGKAVMARVTMPRLQEASFDAKSLYWVDLDTGKPLPGDNAAGNKLWVTPKKEEGGSEQELRFNIETASDACGIYRIGVVMASLPQQTHDMLWQSAVIGEYLTLHVSQPLT